MRYCLTLSLLLVVTQAISQNNIKLPVVIPASPEVTELSKAGALSAGLHTGSANVSIPLYSFSVNSLNFNIGLSYNSNGIRVDDVPSRVGLGWNLMAGGVVSRTIHDEPDGDVPYLPPPANVYEKNQAMLDYLNEASLEGKDTEWDEFSYNFNGLSGKFFIDASGNGHCIPHTNLKVKVHGHNSNSKSIDITTPDGIRYEFGYTIKEKTKEVDIIGGTFGNLIKSVSYETAWFLEKIITPEGGIVDLSYKPVSISVAHSPYQTLIKPYNSGTVCDGTPCAYSEQTGINTLQYNTYYVTRVTTSGITVDFSYEDIPGSSDKRLVNLGVTASGNIAASKWYKFSYLSPTNTNYPNPRFFLSKISDYEVGSGGDGTNLSLGRWLTHDFEYIDPNGMPPRLSYSQDWYGYYNGVPNVTYFAPYIPEIAPYVVNGTSGANRNPGTLEQMQKGILKKVTYPTCGTQEFHYSPHTIGSYNSSTSWSNASVSGSGLGVSNPWTHTSNTFTSNVDQQVTLYLSSHKSPAFPEAPSGEGDRIYELRLKKSPSGEQVFYRRYYNYTSESVTVTLQSNTNYYLEMIIKGEVNAGSASMNFNPTNVTSYENKIVGGVRVSHITSYDPVSGKSTNKYYNYAASADFTKSSGVASANPTFYAAYKTGTFCSAGMNGYIGTCDNYMVSSSSLLPVITFGGSSVAYNNVVESDDISFANGFVEHFFNTTGGASSLILIGNSPLNTPSGVSADFNGLEYKTRYYKKAGNSFVLLKELQNEYDYGPANQTKSSFIIRKRWSAAFHTSPPDITEFDGFDLVQYNYSSGWIKHSVSKTIDYDENGQNPLTITTSHTYNDPTHLQPTRTEFTTSTGTKAIEYKYPNDFKTGNVNAPNVYDAMVQKNIIVPVIEQTTFKGPSTFLQKTMNSYSWFNNNSLIAPSNIKTSIDPSNYDTRVTFNAYNSLGHIVEQQKTSDVQMAYVWGYAPERPIAEVINASTVDVAYTSFEAGAGTGNWIVTSTLRDGTNPVTGRACYDLVNGAISKAVSSGKVYIVSYWTKNTTPFTIVGTQGAVVAGKSINNWKYFEHKISGVSSLQLSGSGLIDELRLYPEKAQMNSYTYEPLVGISSHADVNSRVTYYEYDAFQRLLRVKDADFNILKQYDYAYCKAVGTCTNTLPSWQLTGNYRCAKNSNNNNTGEQQQEEKDMNNCSPSFNETRWVTISTNTTACPVVPNCTGEDKRVVNGVCQTGVKVITEQSSINGMIHCTYHYEWTDGYWSPNYQSSGTSNCITIQ